MTSSNRGGLGPAWCLGRVLLAGLVLLLASGKIRGPEPDRLARELVAWFQTETTAGLAHWCHPVMASVIVGLMGVVLFSLGLLACGDAIRRMSSLVEYVVESELGRRRGRRLAALAVSLVFSLPAAAMLALTSAGNLALYAVLYFVLAYGFICFATDAENASTTLGVYARLRHALAKGCEPERDADEGDGFDCQ